MDLIINNRDNYEHLDIEKFSKCLLNPDACYKFYWLEAILNILANSSETKFTFDVIADEMILNAWNTVLKYHIHLGNLRMDGSSEDALESIILTLFKYSNQGYKITKREIKVKIKEYSTIIKKDKEILLTMVPYRLLKPFVESKYKNYDLKRLLNLNYSPKGYNSG